MKVAHYLRSNRSKYEKLSPLTKAVVVGLALILGFIGIALLAIPIVADLSVILILLSLGILSFQFSWAQSALTYITDKLENKSFRKKFFTFVTILFVISIAVLAVYRV